MKLSESAPLPASHAVQHLRAGSGQACTEWERHMRRPHANWALTGGGAKGRVNVLSELGRLALDSACRSAGFGADAAGAGARCRRAKGGVCPVVLLLLFIREQQLAGKAGGHVGRSCGSSCSSAAAAAAGLQRQWRVAHADWGGRAGQPGRPGQVRGQEVQGVARAAAQRVVARLGKSKMNTASACQRDNNIHCRDKVPREIDKCLGNQGECSMHAG